MQQTQSTENEKFGITFGEKPDQVTPPRGKKLREALVENRASRMHASLDTCVCTGAQAQHHHGRDGSATQKAYECHDLLTRPPDKCVATSERPCLHRFLCFFTHTSKIESRRENGHHDSCAVPDIPWRGPHHSLQLDCISDFTKGYTSSPSQAQVSHNFVKIVSFNVFAHSTGFVCRVNQRGRFAKGVRQSSNQTNLIMHGTVKVHPQSSLTF